MTREAHNIQELVDQELTGIEGQLEILARSQSIPLFEVHLEIQSRIRALRMFSAALGKEILKPHAKTVNELYHIFDRMREGEHIPDEEIGQMIVRLRGMVERIREDLIHK